MTLDALFLMVYRFVHYVPLILTWIFVSLVKAVLLIAIGSVGYFLDKLDEDYGKKGNMKFFLFAVVTAWLLVIAFFLTFVSGLHEKLASVNWFLTVSTGVLKQL